MAIVTTITHETLRCFNAYPVNLYLNRQLIPVTGTLVGFYVCFILVHDKK